MTTRANYDLPPIYRGDDWDVVIGFYARGGGLIGTAIEGAGATLTDGSDQLVLPTGVNIRSGARPDRSFNAGDVGTQVTLLNGDGITDGTTILDFAVDGRSATMSAPATADRTADAVVAVRSKDISGFTITGQVRDGSEDGAILFSLPFVLTRALYGALEMFIPSKARAIALGLTVTGGSPDLFTDRINKGGIYDIQFVDGDGITTTPVLGKVAVTKDRTHS